jgi:DNA-directed RNA polymerase subunit RPC12/RpoP
MAIAVSCSACAKTLTVPDDQAGARVRCPGCGATVVVPGERGERPRAQGSSSTMWIVLAVVGGVLVVSCLGCGVLGMVLLGPAVQKVREAAQRTERMNDLKQIGLAVINHIDQKNKGPANVNELAPLLGMGSKVESRLRGGEIQVVWNAASFVQQTDGTSNTLMAWETRPDPSKNGERLVAFMDGHVDWLTVQQFQTAPKAKTVGGGKAP